MGIINSEEDIRRELMDYYGTAMTMGYPWASLELAKAESADTETLIEMARETGLVKFNS